MNSALTSAMLVLLLYWYYYRHSYLQVIVKHGNAMVTERKDLGL
jgi:hypothetical protein